MLMERPSSWDWNIYFPILTNMYKTRTKYFIVNPTFMIWCKGVEPPRIL